MFLYQHQRNTKKASKNRSFPIRTSRNKGRLQTGSEASGSARRASMVTIKKPVFWVGVVLAVSIRLALVAWGVQERLGRRVEVATPVTSLMRLSEGYWLRQLGMSPYAGSAYHGSPLLLATLGFLAKYSFVALVIADLVGAFLLSTMCNIMQSARELYLATLNITSIPQNTVVEEAHVPGWQTLGDGDIIALLYLLNPCTIAVCVGGSTSPVENAMIILGLHGALAGNVPLAAFGWAMATHLSMYPAVLFIPITLLLLGGPDMPQRSLFDLEQVRQLCSKEGEAPNLLSHNTEIKSVPTLSLKLHLSQPLSLVALRDLVIWSVVWWLGIIGLCRLVLGSSTSIWEMLSETYGFIITVDDLAPNLGLFWYFFTEVFTHFRSFFLMVFHANILFVIVPVTIRLYHRPLFLAFILVTILTMLKSYPSAGDATLSLGMLSLFSSELAGFRFVFPMLNGYLLVGTLSPVMYNLWIWRGTGNANFYFAMALLYASLQTVLIVESIGTVNRYDRALKTQVLKQSKVRITNSQVQT